MLQLRAMEEPLLYLFFYYCY